MREMKRSAACKLNWIEFNWIELKWNYVCWDGKLIIDTRLKIQISYIPEACITNERIIERTNERWANSERQRATRYHKILRLIAEKKKLLVRTWWKIIIIFLVCVSFSSFDSSWVSHAVWLLFMRSTFTRRSKKIHQWQKKWIKAQSIWTPCSDEVLLKWPWLCLPI